MNKIDNTGTGIAALGRNEDSMIAHVAPGEMVVPPVISPQTQMLLQQEMMSAGLDPNEYTVGQGMSINPITGLAEFGFLKKLGKSLKKVVKKVAPVLSVAMPFIPGLNALTPLMQGAISAGVGKAAGLDTKDALLGGLTAGLGAKFAGGTGTAGKGLEGLIGTSGKFFGKEGTFRNILGAGKEYVLPGKDGRGLIKNIFGGGDSLQPYSDAEIDEMLTTMDPSVVEQIVAERNAEISSPNIVRQVLGSTPGQSGIGVIEDLIKGRESDFTKPRGQQLFDADGKPVSSGGFGLGGAGGIAGLAALYGLATKKAAEKTEGGLRDIRLSTRPDLMPQQTFQGFDVGVRPGMSYGGGMEYRPGFAMGTPDGLMKEMIGDLDLRPGGRSVGPGTETSDDIPAMLSDGEFVHTAKANKGLGGFKIEKNKDSITLYPTGKPDREQGFKNNDMMMKMFEDYQEMVS